MSALRGPQIAMRLILDGRCTVWRCGSPAARWPVPAALLVDGWLELVQQSTEKIIPNSPLGQLLLARPWSLPFLTTSAFEGSVVPRLRDYVASVLEVAEQLGPVNPEERGENPARPEVLLHSVVTAASRWQAACASLARSAEGQDRSRFVHEAGDLRMNAALPAVRRKLQGQPDDEAERPPTLTLAFDPAQPPLARFLSTGLPYPGWRLTGGGADTIPIDGSVLTGVCDALERALGASGHRQRQVAIRECRQHLGAVLSGSVAVSLPEGVSLPGLPSVGEVLDSAVRPLDIELDDLRPKDLRRLQHWARETNSSLRPDVGVEVLSSLLAVNAEDESRVDLEQLRTTEGRPPLSLKVSPRTPAARRQVVGLLGPSTEPRLPVLRLAPGVGIEDLQRLLDRVAMDDVLVDVEVLGAHQPASRRAILDTLDGHEAVVSVDAPELPILDGHALGTPPTAAEMEVLLLVEWILIAVGLADPPADEWPARKALKNRIYQRKNYYRKNQLG